MKKSNDSLSALEEAHPNFVSPNLSRVAANVVLIIVIIASFIFDYVLFSPTSEHFGRQAFADSPMLMEVARLILPASLLAVDLTIAVYIYLATEEREDSGSYIAYYVSIVIGFGFVLVMPASIIATQLASRPTQLDATQEAALNWHLAALVILSVISHAVVVFSGRYGHDAKTWLLFVLRHGWLSRVLRRRERDHQQTTLRVQDTYTRYQSLIDSHNATYPARPVKSGPYSRCTRDVLKEIAGYDVIVFKDEPSAPSPTGNTDLTDATGSAAAVDSPPPSIPPPVADTEGSPVFPDLHENLAVREADNEVRP